MYTFARLAFIVVEISQFENQLVQNLKKLLCNAKGGELMTHGLVVFFFFFKFASKLVKIMYIGLQFVKLRLKNVLFERNLTEFLF